MAISRNVWLAVATVAVLALIVAWAMGLFGGGDGKVGPGPGVAGQTDTTIVLENDGQGGCRVVKKEQQIRTRPNHKITWTIDRNDCDNNTDPVTIGNFRTAKKSNNPTCIPGREGTDFEWPFVEDEANEKLRQGITKVELHTRTEKELGLSTPLTLQYDVCTGPDADTKWDPEIVIEPS